MLRISHNHVSMSLIHKDSLFFSWFVLIDLLNHVIDTDTSHLFEGGPDPYGHKPANSYVIATTVRKDAQ